MRSEEWVLLVKNLVPFQSLFVPQFPVEVCRIVYVAFVRAGCPYFLFSMNKVDPTFDYM